MAGGDWGEGGGADSSVPFNFRVKGGPKKTKKKKH